MRLYCQFGRFERGGEANFSLPSRRSVANMPDEGNIEHSTEKYQYFSAK